MRKTAAIIMMLVLAVPAFSAENTYTVKAGISFSQQWGLYIANVVEKDGAIANVIIDRLANGKSSKELHGSEARRRHHYGIKPVSTLGKDW